MPHDNLLDGVDRLKPTASRARLEQLRHATTFCLERLGRLLTAWENGTARGHYEDARDEVLAEMDAAQAYYNELVTSTADETDAPFIATDWSPEIRDLRQTLKRMRKRMDALDIAPPRS